MGTLRSPAILALLLSTAHGIIPSLCNTTTDSANASGVFPFSPGFEQLPQAAWATTVLQVNDTVESTLWFSTGGANYADDLALYADGCAWYITGLPTNTIELAQDDPGDCSKTFTQACRQALISSLEDSANLLTRYTSPPPYSNLTAGVLPTLCADIYASLGSGGSYELPQACVQEFGLQVSDGVNRGNSLTVSDLPLTGYNTSIITNSPCSLQVGDGKTFHSIETQTDSAFGGSYGLITREAGVAMSVYFQVANDYRQFCCDPAAAQLSCVRVQKFSTGSRVSYPLDKGTPYVDATHAAGLSKGDLAGIIVGPVVFAIILAGVAVWFWRTKRSKRQRRDVNDGDGKGISGDGPKELSNGAGWYELSPADRKPESDSAPIVEMGLGRWRPVELSSEEQSREMNVGTTRAELRG